MKPELEYVRAIDPAEKKRLAALVIGAYRPGLERMVRRLLPARFSEHAGEGFQAAAIGILRALAVYNPDTPGVSATAPFWPRASFFVRDEIRAWIDAGIYWRKRPHYRREGQADIDARVQAARMPASMDDASLDGETLHDRLASEIDVENVVSEAELHGRLAAFIDTLTATEKQALLGSGRARGHLSLVERATAFVRG